MDNFYGRLGGSIDLRSEFRRILDGHLLEPSKAVYGLLRSMNVDSSGNLIVCPCVNKNTGEPDRDYYCPICMAEKYIWTESLVKFYRVSITASDHGNSTFNKVKEYGQTAISDHLFYFQFDVDIKKADKIIDIKLDLEGNIIKPIKRDIIWRINEIHKYRGDRGRVEFIKVFTSNEDAKYLAPPIVEK